jgi:hypothetical protein
MKQCSRFLSGLLILLLTSCMPDSEDAFKIFTESYDFSESHHDWQGGFSDFPSAADDSAFYELRYEYTELNGTKSLMLSGNNHSDDLFMFLKKKLTGLEPNRTYTVTFEVELASDAVEGSVGAGGAPGESVYLKAGATSTEPKSVIENNWHVMNIDKGQQSQGGEDMFTVGNIAVPSDSYGYTLITRSNSTRDYSNPFIATTNSKGELWLIVGTDSGFEGITTVYYTRITAVFSLAK